MRYNGHGAETKKMRGPDPECAAATPGFALKRLRRRDSWNWPRLPARLFVTVVQLPEIAAILRVLHQAATVRKSKNAFTKDVFPCLARRTEFLPSLAVSVSRDSVWR